MIPYTSGIVEKYTVKHTLDAYLSREGRSTRTLVNLTHGGNTAIHLTPAKAVAMGEILTRLGV